jgi:Fic family protein
MRIPRIPPDIQALWRDPLRLQKIVEVGSDTTIHGKYLHWDQLRHRPPPYGLSLEEWWWGLKLRRQSLARPVPLMDPEGKPFHYLLVDPIPERLHEIDLGTGGSIAMPDPITNPETKDHYYVSSLIEEAITSSQLEGATTARRVAREMLRAGRQPRDRSERMILNNFLTMKLIGSSTNEPLSREFIFELHRQVTDGTLDDPSGRGRFRHPDEDIAIYDEDGSELYRPPPARGLEERIQLMCDFANGVLKGSFVHPVIRSIILHFWLAYEHPFVDGNGRTARALFYWSMLRHRYWLFEFVSISNILLQARAKYSYSFLYTETDDNDLTYFILYHLDIIRRATKELHDYIQHKTDELRRLELELRGLQTLNYRQRALMTHALRHPVFRYSIEGHRRSHAVAYQTARTDLLTLHERGLLDKIQAGKKFHFIPARGLHEKLYSLPRENGSESPAG